MKNFRQKGITLMEILVVLAILIFLVSVVLAQFSDIKENQVLKNALEDAASALRDAQSKSLASLDSSEYGVRFESDRVIIFKGKVFSEVASDNQIIDIISPANITDVTLAGVSASSGELYFEKLSGAPSKTGVVTVATPSSEKTITIFATGSVGID